MKEIWQCSGCHYDDSKQTIEFINIVSNYTFDCPGNQVRFNDSEECHCFNPAAIGEECILPNTEAITPPETTTTTTEAARYTSKEKDPETDAVDSTLIHTAETIEATTGTVDTQTPSTEDNPKSTIFCDGFIDSFYREHIR